MSSRSSNLPELEKLAERYVQAAAHHRSAAELQARHGKTRQAEDAIYRAEMADLWHEKVLAEIEAISEADLTAASAAELQAECRQLKLQIANLRLALQSNRRISMAVGILMSRYSMTSGQAFEALRRVSQSTHRKLHDVADEILYVGDIPTAKSDPETGRESLLD